MNMMMMMIRKRFSGLALYAAIIGTVAFILVLFIILKR